MDKLRAMRVFASVAHEGSLADAGRMLDLTPTAVSRQLAELEADLGARLVNRTTRSLALTEVGQRFLESVQHILRCVDEGEALVRDDLRLSQGRLRVQAASAFAFHQLVPHLSEFRAEYPKVALQLAVNAAVTRIDENFDVCVLVVEGPLADSAMVARPLARSEIVSCASPGYLSRRGWPVHPAELERHDVVLPHNLRRELRFSRASGAGALLAAESVTVTLPTAAFDSNDTELNYLAVMAGMGIAGLPSFVVADALRAGRLERVLADWHVLHLRVYAAVPARRHLPARTRAFIDFLCARFGGRDVDPWLAGEAPAWGAALH